MSDWSDMVPRWIFAGLVALAVLISSVTLVPNIAGASTNTATPTARQELRTSLASAKQQGFVHVVVHFASGGKTGQLVVDATGNSGTESITIGTEQISIVFLNGVAYFMGNEAGLVSYLGFSQSVASSITGHWISMVPTDAGYQSVILGITIPSALGLVTPRGSLKRGRRLRISGVETTSIYGPGASGHPPTTLFIETRGKHLPIEAVESSGHGKDEVGETVSFSHWGANFSVTKPPATYPFSSLLSS